CVLGVFRAPRATRNGVLCEKGLRNSLISVQDVPPLLSRKPARNSRSDRNFPWNTTDGFQLLVVRISSSILGTPVLPEARETLRSNPRRVRRLRGGGSSSYG